MSPFVMVWWWQGYAGTPALIMDDNADRYIVQWEQEQSLRHRLEKETEGKLSGLLRKFLSRPCNSWKRWGVFCILFAFMSLAFLNVWPHDFG